MTGLSISIVTHRLPTDPACPPVKQKLRKYKSELSLKIKEEISKQLDARILQVTESFQCRRKTERSESHETQSFVDCSAGYHQIEMHKDDAEKTNFITPWGAYNYKAMTTLFHDMIHKEIEVYVDDVIIKSKKGLNYLDDMRKFFARLRKYNLKLNLAKCVFGVHAGKLLGFIVSRRGIELDPSKIKAIRGLPPSKNYLSNPLVLVPPESGKPLLLYISVLDNAFNYILGQHDKTGKKEKVIYYMSKKFTSYEARYSLLERTCCAVTWVAQKLRHYLSSHTTYLISRMDPLKYIFQKPMPTGKLAKWQILLSKFDIVYVTQKAVKAQTLADHMAENPIDDDYRPLKTYFPDEEVAFVGEDISEEYDGWRMFFDGAKNLSGSGIGAVLISSTGQHYPVSAKLRFLCSNNMAEYEACIAIDLDIQEMLIIGDSNLLIHQHLHHNYIDPIYIHIYEQPTYCFHVEEEPDGKPWYDDIRGYLKNGEYTKDATSVQKRTIQRLANQFFLSGEILYRRTPDLGLLRCVEAGEASRLIEEIHAGTCGPHMNGFTLSKKILRSGYFWLTMETDCIRYVQKCHQCQTHADMILVPPNELHVTSSPWPFAA
ncbi:uncharacterized protein LOC125842899 [Solanum stenotomum]|uniref:uncharacterized protein LOC125842899 n=1 Tax=Solanum stenotomum TaxID=172797 RepID=UPI0020CFEDF0|nr:uncharacterized protein LOC125842899 [Solanum stenotomum]